MNCRPGETAMVVGLAPWLASGNGCIVRLRLAPPVHGQWELSTPLALRVSESIVFREMRAVKGQQVFLAALDDQFLRPLRPLRELKGEDESFSWAGRPAEPNKEDDT